MRKLLLAAAALLALLLIGHAKQDFHARLAVSRMRA